MTVQSYIEGKGLQSEVRQAFGSIRRNASKLKEQQRTGRADEEALNATMQAQMNLSCAYLQYEYDCRSKGEAPVSKERFLAEAETV